MVRTVHPLRRQFCNESTLGLPLLPGFCTCRTYLPLLPGDVFFTFVHPSLHYCDSRPGLLPPIKHKLDQTLQVCVSTVSQAIELNVFQLGTKHVVSNNKKSRLHYNKRNHKISLIIVVIPSVGCQLINIEMCLWKSYRPCQSSRQ